MLYPPPKRQSVQSATDMYTYIQTEPDIFSLINFSLMEDVGWTTDLVVFVLHCYL